MKFLNKILFGTAAIALAGSFSSCKEEATLSGADAVYITMANTDVSMLAGDTIRLSATVQNASGKEIVTPITWSTGDESICKIVEIVETKKVKNPDYVPEPEAGSPEEGEGEGGEEGSEEGDQNVASRANTTDEYLTVETRYVGLTALPGAQGKQTTVKATLENGMFALTTVSVTRRQIEGAVKAEKAEMMSYADILNDTCWFNVDPIGAVDDYDIDFNIRVTEKLTDATDPSESQFRFGNGENGDPIFIDRENSRVGVVFTAPRFAGKAMCSLRIGNEEVSSADSTLIYLFPLISAGLEYRSGGQVVRPLAAIQTPSNIKPRLETVSLDINSTHLVGVCVGIRTTRADDIAAAMAAEEAGYFTWEINGSSVIVEETFFDTDYQGGYVSYLKVRSGARSGFTRCVFTIPGECIDSDTEPQEFICDINVADFNTEYPINAITVSDQLSDGHMYQDGEVISAIINRDLYLYINTVPDANYEFHIPQVTSSDPSILSVEPRADDAGISRVFKPHRTGTVTLTITSLNVERHLTVQVKDEVENVMWNKSLPATILKGKTETASVNIFMTSNPNSPVASYNGPIEWTSSDPSVAQVVVDPSDPRVISVTGIETGTATITASVPSAVGFNGHVLQMAEVKVDVPSYNNSNTTERYLSVGSQGDEWAQIQLSLSDSDVLYFEFVNNGSWDGTFSGSGASIFVFSQDELQEQYDGCPFEVTVTDNGDGTSNITGYFEAPNGMRYQLTGVTCTNNY